MLLESFIDRFLWIRRMNRQLIAGLSNDLTPSQELLTVFQFDLRIVTVISKKAWNPSSLDKDQEQRALLQVQAR